MSEEGGENLLNDFESDTSAVEYEMRARIERAENDAINQINSQRLVKSQKRYKAPSGARIAILTLFGSLLGACFIFLVVLLAIRVGGSNFLKDLSAPQEKPAVAELYRLNFKEHSILYGLGDKEAKEDGSYLMSEYDSENKMGYEVITRPAQLQRLQNSFYRLTGEEKNFLELLELDEDFFSSGSVLAIVSEGNYIGSLQTIELNRNQAYGLSIEMQQTNLAKYTFETQPPLAGYLNLIKVDNVQPTEITVYIDNK